MRLIEQPPQKKSPFVGPFTFWWNNRPPPFNPTFDPKAKERAAYTTESMVRDDFHASHTREECAAEWRRRYDKQKHMQNNL